MRLVRQIAASNLHQLCKLSFLLGKLYTIQNWAIITSVSMRIPTMISVLCIVVFVYNAQLSWLFRPLQTFQSWNLTKAQPSTSQTARTSSSNLRLPSGQMRESTGKPIIHFLDSMLSVRSAIKPWSSCMTRQISSDHAQVAFLVHQQRKC